MAEIAAGRSLRIHEPSLEVSVLKVDAAAERARVAVLTGEGKTTKLLAVEQALAITLVWLGQPTIFYVKLSGIDGGTCRISILKGAVPLASLESKRVGAQRFAGGVQHHRAHRQGHRHQAVTPRADAETCSNGRIVWSQLLIGRP